MKCVDGLTATLIGTRMTLIGLMGTDKCKQRFSQRRKGAKRNALMAYGHWLIERILPYSQNDRGE